MLLANRYDRCDDDLCNMILTNLQLLRMYHSQLTPLTAFTSNYDNCIQLSTGDSRRNFKHQQICVHYEYDDADHDGVDDDDTFADQQLM